MRYSASSPILSDVDGGAWIKPESFVRFAQTLESSGMHAVSFTDHPAASAKWLESGGHESFDPLVALAFIAGATKTLQLMTHLIVAPYRNPFIQAKAMASLDLLSGGRTIFTMGAGYLRSEFFALGVDFEERLALMDESIEVIRGVWSGEPYSYEGRHFSAKGVIMKPTVVQKPHPPLWLGGNSTTVMNRVAKWGQGWSALIMPAQAFSTTRSRVISTPEELAAVIIELGDKLEANGRARTDIDIQVQSEATALGKPMGDQQRIDELGRLAEMGVTWVPLTVPEASFEKALDTIQAFGENIVPKVG